MVHTRSGTLTGIAYWFEGWRYCLVHIPSGIAHMGRVGGVWRNPGWSMYLHVLSDMAGGIVELSIECTGRMLAVDRRCSREGESESLDTKKSLLHFTPKREMLIIVNNMTLYLSILYLELSHDHQISQEQRHVLRGVRDWVCGPKIGTSMLYSFPLQLKTPTAKASERLHLGFCFCRDNRYRLRCTLCLVVAHLAVHWAHMRCGDVRQPSLCTPSSSQPSPPLLTPSLSITALSRDLGVLEHVKHISCSRSKPFESGLLGYCPAFVLSCSTRSH